MDTVHADRLVTLATFLRDVPEDRFNLLTFADGYVTESYLNKAGLHKGRGVQCSKEQFEAVNCGTTACALGWAAMIDQFKPMLTLELRIDDALPSRDGRFTVGSFAVDGDVIYTDFDGLQYSNFNAARKFFGLGKIHHTLHKCSMVDFEEYYLFDPSNYSVYVPTITDVIERISDVLYNHGFNDHGNVVRNLIIAGLTVPQGEFVNSSI